MVIQSPAMRKFFLLGAVFGLMAFMGLTACSVDSGRDREYRFEPYESELSGTFTMGIYYGRPGYGENPETDEKETAYILVLGSPIDVLADGSDEINRTRRGISEVQLVFHSFDSIDTKAMMNRRITAKGKLFASHTAHHHRPVLMDVESLQMDQG